MPVKDPFMLLMEEDNMEEDAKDGDASYQAILCSFYDIIHEHPPPKSSLVSTSFESLSDLHMIPHQITEEQHVELHNGFNISTHHMLNSGASRITLSGNSVNLQSSLFQEESGDSSLVVPVQNFISPNSTALNALSSTTKAQHHHAAIKFNDGEVSCGGKGKILNNFSGRGSNAHFHLPSPYKEFSLKLAGVELSFEDLKLRDHYAALYVGEPRIPVGHPKYGDNEKVLAMRGKSGKKRTANAPGKSGKKRIANAHEEYVDLKGLMVKAVAVGVGDARIANELLQGILQQGASAYGNGSQRVAHYFSEALVARMSGTGGHQSRAILHSKKSAVTVFKVFKLYFEVSPFLQVAHYFANQSILKVAKGASRLHIVDYGLEEHGIQWALLINALADQKGGPPLLVITVIDSPQLGNNPAGKLEESGRRLAAHARAYKVPFQHHAIASSKWEDLDSSSFHFHEDEVLVVSCSNSLRCLADEGVDLVSPRQKLLMCIHSLKPHLLITADMSTGYNFSFASRFQEALYYFSSWFDMIDTVWDDIPERLLMERLFYSFILNIVACEGAERVETAETYKQRQLRIERAGFKQLLVPPAILSRSTSHLKQHYHKDFFVHDDDDNKWMLLGWRGRTLVAVSAWKLSHAQLSSREEG